jgi:hypothetical protein
VKGCWLTNPKRKEKASVLCTSFVLSRKEQKEEEEKKEKKKQQQQA